MCFEVETTYDQATIRAFQDILNHTIRAKRIRLARSLFIVAGCVGLLYALLWLWAAAAAGASLIPGLSGIVAGALLFLLGIFYERYTSRSGRHMVDSNPAVIRYTFSKRGYTTRTGDTTAKSGYEVIQSICSGEGFYVIMLGRNQGFVLDKARFLRGDPGEFGAFLEERTGKTLQAACGGRG